MKLFISTGGRGERLYPLTKDIPKPLVLVAGKPVLHHIMDWAKGQPIDEVVLLNGYLAEKIISYFNHNNFGIKITHLTELSPLGSGGCLKFASRYASGRFAFISGDVVCAVDLKEMLLFHEKNKADITVHVHHSTHSHDSDILQTDPDGRVLRFISKHDNHTDAGTLTNSGLCIMEENILRLMEKKIFTMETYLYPRLLEKNSRFFAYHTDEFIADMGTPERLKKCEKFLSSQACI